MKCKNKYYMLIPLCVVSILAVSIYMIILQNSAKKIPYKFKNEGNKSDALVSLIKTCLWADDPEELRSIFIFSNESDEKQFEGFIEKHSQNGYLWLMRKAEPESFKKVILFKLLIAYFL